MVPTTVETRSQATGWDERPAGCETPRPRRKKMHPGLFYWWKQRHAQAGFAGHEHGDAAEVSCGLGGGGGWGGRGWHGHGEWRHEAGGHDDPGGGAFGVRRPLRFLAYKLELDEKQVGELAKILSDLKTERAQADVDGRRTISGF